MFHAYVVDALQSSFALPLDATVRIYSRTRRHTLEYGFTHYCMALGSMPYYGLCTVHMRKNTSLHLEKTFARLLHMRC